MSECISTDKLITHHTEKFTIKKIKKISGMSLLHKPYHVPLKVAFASFRWNTEQYKNYRNVIILLAVENWKTNSDPRERTQSLLIVITDLLEDVFPFWYFVENDMTAVTLLAKQWVNQRILKKTIGTVVFLGKLHTELAFMFDTYSIVSG